MTERRQESVTSSGDEATAEKIGIQQVAKQPANVSTDAFEPKEKRNGVATATFATVDDFHYHKPVAEYEGIHRWDPDFHWDQAEEKKLVRKVSLQSLRVKSYRPIF